MVSIKKKNGTIGILTGGGDVPGLNPAIRAVTIRAIREGFKVIGLRRGWKGLVSCIRDKKLNQDECFQDRFVLLFLNPLRSEPLSTSSLLLILIFPLLVSPIMKVRILTKL